VPDSRALPPDHDAQEAIEADEMVDVGVGDEEMFEALNSLRRQIREVAEVDEDRAPLKQRFDIKRLIA
jgi:hypothetical protein